MPANEIDPLFSASHFYMVLTIMTPFMVFWWDTRRQNRKMHDETQNQNMAMHRENQDRLLKIETQLEPVYRSWLNGKGRA